MSEEYKYLRHCFKNIDEGEDEGVHYWFQVAKVWKGAVSALPTYRQVPELSNELLKAIGLFMAKTALEAKLGKIEKRLERAIEELLNDEYPEYERMATLIETPIRDSES